jgi:penicillin-binding protein 1C
VVAGVALVVVTGTWASLDPTLHGPRPSRLILDRHGAYLGEVPGDGDALGYWDLTGEVPERVRQATLQTEDRFFDQHPGVHLPSVVRAAWQDVRGFRVVSGASTLAMQVARMQSPGRRTLVRKAREALEALWLVHRHGHQRVLKQYLRLAPYGNRVRGVVRAARLYFDKPVEDLSWLQAAFLAGLPQRPAHLDPFDDAGRARALHRAHRILGTLRDRGVISHDAYLHATRSDLSLVRAPRRPPEALHAVLALSAASAARRGTTLAATLDAEAQHTVSAVLRDNLASLRGALAGNTAALVVDTRRGEVLVHVGSADYFSREDRGALDYTTVRRSPGSAIKPLVYALALDRGQVTAATELPDTPLDFQSEDGRGYLPQNMGHSFLGPMLAREALGNSRNIPALRVLSDVGVEAMLRFLEVLGVALISWEPGSYGLGLALGNLPVTLEELVRAYGVLANRGRTLPLRRFLDEPSPPSSPLFSPEAAQMVTHVLGDPVARRPTFPAGGPLDFDYAVAVKTGTSQGHRDAWAVAYSDRLLVAVWVGAHDWRKMNRVTGARGAAPAVKRIMDTLMPRLDPHVPVLNRFPAPEGWREASVCALSGQRRGPHCPHGRTEFFAPGTEPRVDCLYHRPVAVDRRNGLRATPGCPVWFVEQRVLLDLPPVYASWARAQRLDVAPRQSSPLCPPGGPDPEPSVTITEPRDKVRYLWDPDTPERYATIRLAALAHPPEEEVVWLVDGQPVARVGWPHETRWPLFPGTHTIRAALARADVVSRPVTITVRP